MQRYTCQCGQEVFFNNSYCSACNTPLGFVSETQQLHSLIPAYNPAGELPSDDVASDWLLNGSGSAVYRSCGHLNPDIECNWLISPDDDNNQCISCRLTRTIPVLSEPHNMKRWAALEAAKRRMLYSLLRLGLPFASRLENPKTGLLFDFLEDSRTNPAIQDEVIYTGHDSGVITINVAEADPSLREAARVAMNESTRTLVGHFRHEIGHYYWQVLIEHSKYLAKFRDLFGNEDADYKQALEQHYSNGPNEDWHSEHISAYASSHPHEDWAESWAHYLLATDTVETALSYGLIPPVDELTDFEVWLNEWMELSVVLNALNRSTGHYDAYPFVLSEKIRSKLSFVHDIVRAH